MSVLTIPQHYVTEFETNWMFQLQQTPSILSGCVMPATVNGEKKSFNTLGPSTMQRVTDRLGDTRISEIDSDKRWLSKFPYDTANLLDEWDQELLGQIVLPTSEYVQSHGFAYNRASDQTIIDALGGTAYSGENGTDAITFPESQIVGVQYGSGAVPANTGLSIAKLIAAKGSFAKNLVDPSEEIFFVHTQQQLDDLLATTQATSADYAAVKALVDGVISRFMGMTFKQVQLLPIDANGLRSCFAFVKSGVKFTSNGKRVHMDTRPDKNHALQIRTVAMLGAARMDEKKVVKVICDEAP